MSDKNTQKPFYSRIFTELLPNGLKKIQKKEDQVASWIGRAHKRYSASLSIVLLFYFFVLSLFLSYALVQVYQQYQEGRHVWAQEEKKLVYWKNIIGLHPNYPDAYYQAAVSSIRLKQPEMARELLDTALNLDPLFSQAEQLRNDIEAE